jgi:hypothetical protein
LIGRLLVASARTIPLTPDLIEILNNSQKSTASGLYAVASPGLVGDSPGLCGDGD